MKTEPRPRQLTDAELRQMVGPIRVGGSARRSGGLDKSFRYAFDGVVYGLRSQPNMRIHAVAAVAVLGAGLILGLAPIEFGLLLFAIGIVVVTELTNTAIEAAVDLAAPRVVPLARVAKDVAAGAVLVAALVAVAIGALVFWPHVLLVLGR